MWCSRICWPDRAAGWCGRRWRSPKQRKFLFPVKALSALFRGKFLDGLNDLMEQGVLRGGDPSLSDPQGRQRWFSQLYAQKWVVYAKRPFGGPEQVLNYLANYTHRVALSNRRLLAVNEPAQTVTFTWRDYRQGGQVKPLTLSAREFLRRFSRHILPAGLVRIRHYGILSTRRKTQCLEDARLSLGVAAPQKQAMDWKSIARKKLGFDPDRCPFCGQGNMVIIEKLAPQRGPPKSIFNLIKGNGF